MLTQQKLHNLINDYTNTSEEDITKQAEELVIGYTNDVLQGVPAYIDFITKHGVVSEKVVMNLTDFESLPLVDKETYLKQYKPDKLVLSGKLADRPWTISATSGSTGEPFYFPRDSYQDSVYAHMAEAYLLTNYNIDAKKTLYIIAFPMGVWIGGVFTFAAIKEVASKGYSLSVMTPGINKLEVIRAIKNIGHEFDQIIIGSYAPFLKDILDDGVEAGIDWQKLPIKFIFSAEAFSEEFRDYLVEKTNINPLLDTLNHYGTVDLGTMAHETPYSILIRRLAYNNKELFIELFGQDARTPTLAQYDPRLFYFEEFKQNLLCCTAKTGYPLIRYDLKDRGGVRTKKSIEKLFTSHGIDLEAEAKSAGIEKTVWNLPFVFVYERSDFSVSYYAFQVYPEIIRKALLDNSIEPLVSGKFTMEVVYRDGRQHLEIYVEARPETLNTKMVASSIQQIIHQYLKDGSSEYRTTCTEIGEGIVKPVIIIKPYEDNEYFRPGGKQKWVKK